jgi:hypothetical protein
MQSRAARFALVALLLAAGTGAALFTWSTDQRLQQLTDSRADVSARVDHLTDAASELGAAQAAYVAPGQSYGPSLERVAMLFEQISSDTDALRPLVRSTLAADRLASLTEAAAHLADADARAQENLQLEDPRAAANLIFNEAQQAVATMQASLAGLRSDEAAAAAGESDSLRQQWMLALGGAGLLWVIGLLALAPVPRARPIVDVVLPVEPSVALVEAPAAAPSIADSGRATPPPPTVDLGAAADLCTDISRITTAAALPDLLARAAALLDASGIVVWVSAGDELFAVSAHGYDPRVINRLGPIPRSADHATATAWRTGEIRTVAGDMISNGAIVAPMFGPESCLGVLAAEVRHGREEDATTRAVTAMVAAQLATAVGVWPAGGATAPAAESLEVADSQPMAGAAHDGA